MTIEQAEAEVTTLHIEIHVKVDVLRTVVRLMPLLLIMTLMTLSAFEADSARVGAGARLRVPTPLIIIQSDDPDALPQTW